MHLAVTDYFYYPFIMSEHTFKNSLKRSFTSIDFYKEDKGEKSPVLDPYFCSIEDGPPLNSLPEFNSTGGKESNVNSKPFFVKDRKPKLAPAVLLPLTASTMSALFLNTNDAMDIIDGEVEVGKTAKETLANLYNEKLTFRELNTDLQPLDDCAEERALEKFNELGDDHKSDFRNKFFTGKRMITLCSILLFVILLLLAGFIPAVVVLSKGTAQSVNNYFSRNSDFLDKMYLEKHNSTFDTQAMDQKLNYEDVGFDLMNTDISAKTIGQKMYGVAYAPLNSMEPLCGVTAQDVELDLIKLSSITSRIRTYGMQCNQVELILNAIQKLDLDMSVSVGVWIGPINRINKSQMDIAKGLFSRYPQYLFNSVFVGNEVLFRREKSQDDLIRYILSMRRFLRSIGYHKIPVGTAELGSLITRKLFVNCDIIGANVHPFFGGGKVEYASRWVLDFLNFQLQPKNKNSIPIVITEVGWPNKGGKYLSAVANARNFEYFMKDFMCAVRHAGYDYYYFEAFDEPWKSIFYEPNRKWETAWGIFNSDRSDKIDMYNVGYC